MNTAKMLRNQSKNPLAGTCRQSVHPGSWARRKFCIVVCQSCNKYIHSTNTRTHMLSAYMHRTMYPLQCSIVLNTRKRHYRPGGSASCSVESISSIKRTACLVNWKFSTTWREAVHTRELTCTWCDFHRPMTIMRPLPRLLWFTCADDEGDARMLC